MDLHIAFQHNGKKRVITLDDSIVKLPQVKEALAGGHYLEDNGLYDLLMSSGMPVPSGSVQVLWPHQPKNRRKKHVKPTPSR